MRLAPAAVALAVLGLATSSAVPATPVATEWVLTKTEINPARAPQPPHARVTTRNGHIDYDWPGAPQVEFDIGWNLPPSRVKPGAPIVITATLVGRVTGGTDATGYRTATAILHVNDRWVDTAAEIGQSCTRANFSAPITCTPPVTAKGTVSYRTPTYGTTFTIGIGLLNCSNCVVRYTYTAKAAGTAPPKPKPKPEPPPPGSEPEKGTLDISWTMVRRFGERGPNGLVKYLRTAGEISPGRYRVELVVRPKGSRPCRASDAIVWSGPSSGAVKRTTGCRFVAHLPGEGTYRLTAKLSGKDGAKLSGTEDVVVQDWLIFGLGDSNGSGEGSPDIPSPPLPSTTAPVWQSLQCDRSTYSYQAQTARAIENRDPKTSVSFVHLACSGASIARGMIGPYGGINPKAGPALGAQVFQMQRLAGKRELDAVIVSIGVNDLEFGAMVEHCILFPSCFDRGYPKLSSADTLDESMQEKFRRLPGLYDQLAGAFKRAGVPAARVYLTQYFDSTRDANGGFCNPLIRVEASSLAKVAAVVPHPFVSRLLLAASSASLDFDQAEAQWAHDKVLARLNRQVRSAASKHGWGLISGADVAFRNHGYCSGNGSWIVGLFESFERQHDHNGTLHANPLGHSQQAKLAIPIVLKGLYPGGKARSPR
ncbi:MAG TPA: GDSL-type esterase/lipase family protein [Gaiellaceae bacterium]|nr:GDSL-type esterase/lipase family protein [Gaiellaceae bacterium]